jgi:hypothetical protein
MKTAVWTDPIVAETRKWREELLIEAEYDLGRLTKRLMEIQTRHGDKLVSLESATADEAKGKSRT